MNLKDNFLRTGYYLRSNGHIVTRTAGGYWWSGTSGSATHGRDLYTGSAGAGFQDSSYRGFGFAIRCVVRDG